MRDLIQEKIKEINSIKFEEKTGLEIELFPQTLEEQKAEFDAIQKMRLKPESIGKRILFSATEKVSDELGLNENYIYNRIIKEQKIDWENLI